MSVYQGATYTASYTITAANLIGSVVALTVTAPDGTTATPTVTQASPSVSVIPAAQVGVYLLGWSVSGTLTDVLPDQFTVVAPSLGLVSFSELKDQLNISTTDASGDAKLRRFIQSASDVVQNITGPVLPLAVTHTVQGGSSYVILPHRWVKSITTVQEFWGGTVIYTLTNQQPGTGTTGFGYTWDAAISKIVRTSGGFEANFKAGQNAVIVTYIAGMQTIPQDISDATGELIRHWWANGQQPWRSAFSPSGDDAGSQPIMGYAIPNRVIEMLTPYRKKPGIF